MPSYLEATARQRLHHLLDLNSFEEWLPPSTRVTSPHLPQLDLPVAFDDGVVIGAGQLENRTVMVAAQEGGFMGGAVGEVHGAKLLGLLQRAIRDRPDAVLLLLETGGVRLHEANAGLIAVSEVMRAMLAVRAAQIPMVVLIGGANGCFGGMGIAARCANKIVMSEQGRLALSGPEVIETANGVEEFDARDRALVWRTTGGKHRYLLGDCDYVVADDTTAFRNAAITAINDCQAKPVQLTLAALEAEQSMLKNRLADFGSCRDPLDIWRQLGITNADTLPLLEIDAFVAAASGYQIKGLV
jgi:malonate decarboxylase beta subunit